MLCLRQVCDLSLSVKLYT